MTFKNVTNGTGAKRRFAEMHKQRRRHVARAEGDTAHGLGTANRWIPKAARVLVIEDDPDHVRLVERWLKDAGRFAVSIAEDGHIGGELLEAGEWALVVSDIRLPGVDGCQLLRRLRARDQLTPFVLMSGHAQLADAQTAIRHGVSDLFIKPLDRQTFITRVVALADSGGTRRIRDEAPIAALVDGLTHDVANRATLVCGFADLLVAELARPFPRWPQSREYSDTIASAVQGMVVAIHELKEITRWAPLQRKRVDLTQLVADTLRLIEDRVSDRGARLRFNHRDAEIIVESDPVRLRYLVVALILAAFKARNSDDSDVTIAVSKERLGARVAVRATQAIRFRLQLAVEALAQYVPLLNSGTDSLPTLALESHRDAHALCLTLPLADGRTLWPRHRALVVDDDPMLATVVGEILRRQIGCAVDEANSVEQARVLLDVWRYQLVVTDLHLGSGSGLDLHRHLQQVAPQLARATVFMSGDPSLVEIAGDVPTITKPFTNEALADVCKKVLVLHQENVGPDVL